MRIATCNYGTYAGCEFRARITEYKYKKYIWFGKEVESYFCVIEIKEPHGWKSFWQSQNKKTFEEAKRAAVEFLDGLESEPSGTYI